MKIDDCAFARSFSRQSALQWKFSRLYFASSRPVVADGPGWRRSFFFIFPPCSGPAFRSSSGPALSFAGAQSFPCANAQKVTVSVAAIFYGNRRGGRRPFRIVFNHRQAVVAGGLSSIEDPLFISPSCSTPDRPGYLPLAGPLFGPAVCHCVFAQTVTGHAALFFYAFPRGDGQAYSVE